MRARLLLSELRADKVAQLIESARTWDQRCSTVLLACCVRCGAFFLEQDMAWPCDCARDNALDSEHQEYVAFADDEALHKQIHDNLLDGARTTAGNNNRQGTRNILPRAV